MGESIRVSAVGGSVSAVWPSGKIIFQYLATYTNENLHIIIENLPKKVQLMSNAK